MISHKNRKYTKEILADIAKQYSTKGEWQKKHSSSYASSLTIGHEFHNTICSHMVKVSFSVPQMMCRKLLEELLGEKCSYNNRSILSPQELDIFFPRWNLAVEYNGWLWHSDPQVKIRDKTKSDLCAQMGIVLIVIHQIKHKDYELDIKTQIKEKLDIINQTCNTHFTSENVDSIDCQDVYDDIIELDYKNLGNISDKIGNCETVGEFRKKYRNEYEYLKRSKNFHLIDVLRSRPVKVTDEEIIESGKLYTSLSDFRNNDNKMYDLCKRRKLLDETTSHMSRQKITRSDYSTSELIELCKTIKTYREFVNDFGWLYQRCATKELLPEATSHMVKTKGIYTNYSDDQILEKAKTYFSRNNLLHNDSSLFFELTKRNLLDSVEFFNKITVEVIKRQCLVDASKYNRVADFKDDIDLYNKCKKYKMVRQVISYIEKV